MSKVMLVNVTHVEESRVAILDNGVLDAYEIETINRTQIKGNIYNAVVENVHPSLEAAFLKISPELKGFLPLDEVNFNLLPSRGDSRKSGRIGQHLHPGQRIMAQVVREPFSGKPPTVSTYFSLPGRFLVLMPGVDSSGVSRKIDDSTQRDRLKKIVEDLKVPDGFGLIVRTAGLGRTKLELQRDMRYLLRLWQAVQKGSQGAEFPSLVYRDSDLVIRTIRDHLSTDISEVWIDSQETYERALEFVGDVMPARAKILRLYTGDRPLFNKFNLEEQIESIYKRCVPLPAGGEIVIDGTEALTAIDVNSARSRRKGDAEDNILQTNLEAATEISRQLRLRDLGGLIVADFIDMASARNRKKVEDAMRNALKGDKAKHDITRLSKMGLMEIARQRLKGEKMASMYATCPTCDGYGLIKNLEASALAALRKLQTRSTQSDIGRIRVALPPEVAIWMLNNKRDDVVQIERRQNIRVDVELKSRLLRHEVEFETFPREKTEAPAARVVEDRGVPPLPPTLQEVERSEAQTASAPADSPDSPGESVTDDSTESTAPRRRRRRRRKPTGDSAESVPAHSEKTVEPAPTPVAVETPEAPQASVEQSETDTQDQVEGEGEGERPRRRRRRRRRPRGAAGEASQNGEAAAAEPRRAPGAESRAEPTTDKTRDSRAGGEAREEVVPRSVRSDELMPAASAGSRSRRGSRAAAPRGRRRTTSGGRGRGGSGDRSA